MKKTIFFITMLTVISLMLIGCSNDETSLSSDFRASMAPIIIPDGATVTSATLNIFAVSGNGQTIDVHRVTSDWNEVTVTWNSFGGAFDPTIENSFAVTTDWQTVDITSLFNGWKNGTFENFGLLLDQAEVTYPRGDYLSREFYSRHPFLEVCYDEGGVVTCIQEEVIADTYIWEQAPDQNSGTSDRLYTGWASPADLEKQTLLRFEIESTPEGGCSHTIGYWKNHSGYRHRYQHEYEYQYQDDEVTQHLPIMLGNMEVTTSAMAVDILEMKTYGEPKNGITKLLAQLLGSKLSIADGASDSEIAGDIIDADAFLASHSWEGWGELTQEQQRYALRLMKRFDGYNNGYIGPGHCGEFRADHDYSYGDGNNDDEKSNKGKAIKR